MDERLIALALFSAGFVSSFINVMAGGGSVLTLGLMMLLGLDAPLANGTNRLGILGANISGAAAYQSEHFGNVKESLVFGLCALPGAIVGSILAVRVSTALFQRLLAVVMIFVIVTLFLPPRKSRRTEHAGTSGGWLIYTVMVGIGFYGGFIQAGVGFIIMAALRHLLAMDLITINMHKNWIVLFYTVPILFIFGMTGNIDWMYALALAAGNGLGAWMSVKVSVRRGEKVVKIVLCIAILLMAVKFLVSF